MSEPSLLGLPVELRVDIYKILFPNVPADLATARDPPLLHVNRKLREEALPEFYGNTYWRCSLHKRNREGLEPFTSLTRISCEKVRHITSLDLADAYVALQLPPLFIRMSLTRVLGRFQHLGGEYAPLPYCLRYDAVGMHVQTKREGKLETKWIRMIDVRGIKAVDITSGWTFLADEGADRETIASWYENQGVEGAHLTASRLGEGPLSRPGDYWKDPRPYLGRDAREEYLTRLGVDISHLAPLVHLTASEIDERYEQNRT